MSFQVVISEVAEKEIRHLPAKVSERVRKAIDSLALNPRGSGTIKMKGEERMYRMRVGDYRILYEIHDKEVMVLVVRVSHRKDAYRK